MANKKMDEGEILATVTAAVTDGTLYGDSVLSRERQEAWKYYDGLLPKPFHNGNSKYVSQDVYDAVDTARATVLESYSRGGNIVTFAPSGPDDVAAAKVGTAFTHYVINRQNDGYNMRYDMLTNGLMNRTAVVKYWWDENIIKEEEDFEDLDEEALDQLLEDPKVELVEIDVDEESGLASGTIMRDLSKPQVRIRVLPPEEFGISAKAENIQDADMTFHRWRGRKSELGESGFDKKTIDRIKQTGSNELDLEEEREQRHQSTGGAWDITAAADKDEDIITIHEVYIRANFDGQRVRMWKVSYSGDVIIDKEIVNKRPFISFTPLRRPHNFWGSDYVSKVVPTQNARSMLTRGIIDHTVRSNNPKKMVVRGGVINPKELMDNRLNGIVNVTRPDAVLPEQQAPLNPFVFQTIELLDTDKEEHTGISRLSQGMNKDALSSQNAQGMVNDMISLSMIRQKVIMRNFGQSIMELYLEVHNLVVANESRQHIIEVAGEWVEVNTEAWEDRRAADVTLTLGYGEEDKEANNLMGLHANLSSDPSMAPLYTLEKKRNVWAKICEAKGIKDVSSILLTLEEVPPPEPNPAEILELQLRKQNLDIQERQQVLAENKFELERIEAMKKMDLDTSKFVADMEAKRKDQSLKVRTQIHKEYVAEEELKALPLADETKGIVSPNG